MAGRTENLKPYQKGQSGNPSGRPRSYGSLSAMMRRCLEDEATSEKFAKALISQAARGNPAAIRQVLERVDGPVHDGSQLTVNREFFDAVFMLIVPLLGKDKERVDEFERQMKEHMFRTCHLD